MEAGSFGGCLGWLLEYRALGQWGGHLGALQFDKGRGWGEALRLLDAYREHFCLGCWYWGGCLGTVNGAWQAMMFLLGQVSLWELV